MEDAREKKLKLRREVESRVAALSESELDAKKARIRDQLFEFANFKEADTVFFYAGSGDKEIAKSIVENCMDKGKDVAIPLFSRQHHENPRLFKISSLEADMREGLQGSLEPDPERCKPVSFKSVDIAVVPGVAFDEKGARLGSGAGRYDRLAPMLPNTARKVTLAMEAQIVSSIPMESHDKYVDIIITEKRIIYKI
ncbi:MAG: 5-formyltetrahydrofolate cyclo-ligase [Thermodesulfobacteriota bacterium]